jgi:hypothetical protein
MLVAVALAVFFALAPGIAWADGEPPPPPGYLSWSAANATYYATLFGLAAVVVASGVFLLWRIARQARAGQAKGWTADDD